MRPVPGHQSAIADAMAAHRPPGLIRRKMRRGKSTQRAKQRFGELRQAGKVRQGVGFAQYAANHGLFRDKFGLPDPPVRKFPFVPSGPRRGKIPGQTPPIVGPGPGGVFPPRRKPRPRPRRFPTQPRPDPAPGTRPRY